MGLNTTIDNYKKAKALYTKLDNIYYDFEHGLIDTSDFVINQILNDISKLEKYVKYINLSDIQDSTYSKETKDAVKHNTELFTESIYFLRRTFLGAKYYYDLKEAITMKYIHGLDMTDYQLNKFGGTNALSKKITNVLTHVDNVVKFENLIKRIIDGTMMQQEFNRIFNVIRHKTKEPKNK